MTRSRLRLLALLGLGPLLGWAPQAAGATRQERRLSGLRAAIARIAAGIGGTVGVGVHHIESGHELVLNRGVRFPMGSVFKLALAVQLLSRVDQGAIKLDKTVLLQSGDLRPGSGKIAPSFDGPRRMSLHDLLEAMMIDSDNSATDILWKEAGGAKAVMARLGELGVEGISVDRPTALLLRAAVGEQTLPAHADLTPAGLHELLRANSRRKRAAGVAAFLGDSRDTATPESLVMLLLKVWRSEALSPAGTALLVDTMRRCKTGTRRLKGGLPRATIVAHKTGTLRPIVVNDVGIVSLTGRRGHVAVAVLIKESARDLRAQENAIAAISRAVYDHFESGPTAVKST